MRARPSTQVIRSLPQIVDFADATGDEERDRQEAFKTAPYTTAAGPFMQPVWHHGDELARQLALERETAQRVLAAERGRFLLQLEASAHAHEVETRAFTVTLEKKDADFQERLSQMAGGTDAVVQSLDAKVLLFYVSCSVCSRQLTGQ